MSIDLEQFHQVFFEESIEGLDIMESALMELDVDAIDDETINAIFRCAHSIKGGSATFGFTSISAFTHILETLLDQVRSSKRSLTVENINLLLQSVDCMRDMLGLLKVGDDSDTQQAIELTKQFKSLLESEVHDNTEEPKSNKPEPSKTREWHITFSPYSDIFRSGNDPLRNISALSELGHISCVCNSDNLLSLSELDSERSYLSWLITLVSDCSEEDIKEVFEWVEDECDLTLSQQGASLLPDVPISSEQNPSQDWLINFKPSLGLLRTGNDVLKLFENLAELGLVEVDVDASSLPELISMDAESCYLSWAIKLLGSKANEDDIHEVFEWVSDDCELGISLVEQGNKDENAISASSSSAKEQTKIMPKPKPSSKKSSSDTSSIRVGIDKVDNLINMVGELVITQSMLGQLGTQYELDRVPKLMEGLSQLEQNTRELQESVMKIRMLPISFVFSRFPRMVRDLGQNLGKSVELVLTGENTELDKTVMEKIGDPLVHLVRNAVDHGIETPSERSANGKDPTGHIELNAFHQSGNVVIEIKDDGRGLDREKIIIKAIENDLVSDKESRLMSDDQVYDLIFHPGFSTAKTVSDVSGRGVGMDVVKRNIQALNGVVEIESKLNQGSKITVKLPLTLAILDGQLVRVGSNTFIFPLVSIVESLQCEEEKVRQLGSGCSVFKLRDDYVPIIELHKAFSVQSDSGSIDESLLVVVENDGDKFGILVDELLGQQQVVIKSLEQNYQKVEGVSGATILGDGTVALILDIQSIINLAAENLGVKTQTLGLILENQRTGVTASQRIAS
ncbi:chemotaxis protein CheA [Agaribacterium sp. ZY112]|uniref:chemotaxis protein CheA n=1 Tax=Agaribacterium sp. ZY112 TaxID=3233574 RepID=UPI003524879B